MTIKDLPMKAKYNPHNTEVVEFNKYINMLIDARVEELVNKKLANMIVDIDVIKENLADVSKEIKKKK